MISAAVASQKVRLSVRKPAARHPAATASAPKRAAERGFDRSAKSRNSGSTVTRKVDTVPTSP